MVKLSSFSLTALLTLFAFTAPPASAHDWYSKLKSRAAGTKGYSCCNHNPKNPDCLPVQAWTDDTGQWFFLYKDGKEYRVPADAINPDEENQEPFQASACVWQGKVMCFWRKGAGM